MIGRYIGNYSVFGKLNNLSKMKKYKILKNNLFTYTIIDDKDQKCKVNKNDLEIINEKQEQYDYYNLYKMQYAKSIFILGTNRLNKRNGYEGIPMHCHELIIKYAKETYNSEIFKIAYKNNWINDEEYSLIKSI